MTVAITWDLWAGRATPPNLPALDVAGWSTWGWGPALLGVCAYAIWRPASGGVALAAVLAGACVADQARLQPEVASLTLLLVLLSTGPRGRAIARWQLAATWLWGGLHKALSLGWSDDGAAFIAGAVHLDSHHEAVALLLPVAEIALGLLAFVPRCWPVVRWMGVGLHVGIFVTLSPLFADWNEAVWPWNLALAAAAFGLFRPEAGAAHPTGWRPAPVVAITGGAFLVAPALFYVGGMDAYLAHNLYSSNTAVAVVCVPADACVNPFDTVEELGVPLPPEPRLYRQWFRERCQPDEVLVITGIRTRFTDPPEVERVRCPSS